MSNRPLYPHLHEAIKTSIEFLTPNRHLDGIEGVLHNIVRIQLVYLPHRGINVGLCRFCEEEEFDAGLCLETLDTEVARFEDFNARGPRGERGGGEGSVFAGYVGRDWGRGAELLRDGMHSRRSLAEML